MTNKLSAELKTKTHLCFAAIGAALFYTATAHAANTAQHSSVVQTSDFDLNNARDVRALHRRISSEARQLCSDHLHRTKTDQAGYRICVDTAVARAVASSNSKALIDYHDRKMRAKVRNR